jgi:hypothetical protein
MLVETEIPELDEDMLYEPCECFERDPITEGGCMRCWDQQLIPHACWGEEE